MQLCKIINLENSIYMNHYVETIYNVYLLGQVERCVKILVDVWVVRIHWVGVCIPSI